MENKIEKLKECIEQFRKYSENNIDQFVDEFDDSFSFPGELSEIVEEFFNTIEDISVLADDSSILDKLFKDSEEEFRTITKDFMDDRINIRNELSFIKKMDVNVFHGLFHHVLQYYILEHNKIKPYKKFKEEEIKIIIKLANTFIKMIIDDLSSFAAFEEMASGIFVLTSEQLKYIWDLINENKNDLRFIRLMQRLEEIENNLL